MSAQVEIYTSSLCGYCMAAKRLLDSKGVAYQEIDVTFDKEGRRKMTDRANGRTSVPQIFINDNGIGGCDELHALERNSELDQLLAG